MCYIPSELSCIRTLIWYSTSKCNSQREERGRGKERDTDRQTEGQTYHINMSHSWWTLSHPNNPDQYCQATPFIHWGVLSDSKLCHMCSVVFCKTINENFGKENLQIISWKGKIYLIIYSISLLSCGSVSNEHQFTQQTSLSSQDCLITEYHTYNKRREILKVEASDDKISHWVHRAIFILSWCT